MMNVAPTLPTPRTFQINSAKPGVAEPSSSQDHFDVEAQTSTQPKQQTLPSSTKVLQAIARAPQAPLRGLRTAQHRTGCEDLLPFCGGVALAGCLMGGTIMVAMGAAGLGQADSGLNLKLLVPGAVLAGLSAGVFGYGLIRCCMWDGPLF